VGVARQTRQISTALIWLTGILIALGQLGLELTILVLIVTLGGIILAITLRDVLSNVASSQAITSYKPFKLGDWIKVDKFFGRVSDINWMNTVLITPDNEIVYIPNSKITQSIVINQTTPGGTRISIPLIVNRELDLSEVEQALLEIGAELSEELIPNSKPEVRVTSMDLRHVKLALLLRVNNPAKGKILASNVRKKAKKKLDEIQTKLQS
jgi:small conductance mechanosensitive channel